jgi:hypothetical protein
MPATSAGMTAEMGAPEMFYFVNFENAFTTCS